MAFSSGTFNRLYRWATDRANSIPITDTRMDAEFDGMATGLSTCILKDGTQTITADIPFNGKKITGLGDATAATDGLNRQTADARYLAHGQCQLTKSGSNLLLSRKNGNKLFIAGASETIPSGGVTLAPTSLVAPQATTNRQIASSVATLTFASNSIPNGALVGVKGVGGSNAKGYNGPHTVTGSTGTTITFASGGGVVTDASTADTNGTVYVIYYIYAYMSAGTMTLEASTTGYATDSTYGHLIKSGDSTRTLVGIAAIGSGVVWVDSATQRFVRSLFNDLGVVNILQLATAPTSSSTTMTEISTSWRMEMLAWSGENLDATASMSMSDSSAGAATRAGIMLNSVQLDGIVAGVSAAGGDSESASPRSMSAGLTEGYQVITISGRVASGTGTWNAGNAAGDLGQFNSRVGR